MVDPTSREREEKAKKVAKYEVKVGGDSERELKTKYKVKNVM